MGVTISFLYKDCIQFKPCLKKALQNLVISEGKKLGDICLIFTNNDHILRINQEFLNHSYYTDVITFNNSKKDLLNGDIYISVDQVVINSGEYKEGFYREIQRVIIHGFLHLIGFDDKTEDEKIVIRAKEDHYLCSFEKFDIIDRSDSML